MSSVLGMRTISSSGPQLAVGGNWFFDVSVIRIPITAKSPDSVSQMSGHSSRATVSERDQSGRMATSSGRLAGDVGLDCGTCQDGKHR